MTEDTTRHDTPEPAADRIAKVMARAGVASRREAERMILEGRVTVNGKKIDSPALDVMPTDRISVDGKTLDEPQETRLWLYYKPVGLVTSESDEKGRQTVFDALPRDLPRVMTIGRLDLTSEGLLLLTNDGELKRRLELPSTGWLRRYRVRVNGTPNDLTFAPLRRGVTIDGEDFAPMEIKLDSQQGANAWLTVGIREGRNREIRRAMAHVGLQVNRLIRIGYGPFKLAGLEKNQVAEVKRRILRDQLGGLLTGEETAPKEREMRPRGAEGPRKPHRDDGDGPRRSFRSAAAGSGEGRPARPPRGEDAERPARPWSDRPGKPRHASGDDARPARHGSKPAPRDGQNDRPARPWSGKPRPEGAGDAQTRTWPRDGDAPRSEGRAHKDGPFKPRRDAAGPKGDRPFKPRGEGKPAGRSFGAESKPAGDRGFKPRGEGKPAGRGFGGEGKPAGERGFKPRGEGKPTGRSFGAEGKPAGDRPFKPRGEGKPAGRGFGGEGKPAGDRPFKPRGEGKPAGRGFGGEGKPAGDRGFKPRGDGGSDRFSGKPAGGSRPPRGPQGSGFGKKPGGKPAGRPGGKPRG